MEQKSMRALGIIAGAAALLTAAMPASAGLFPHIKSYATLFSYPDESQAAFCRSHYDMSGTMQKVTGTSLIYVNWSDQSRYNPEYYRLADACEDTGADFEDCFLHYSSDTAVPANTYSEVRFGAVRNIAIMEDRFDRVFMDEGARWTADAKFGKALDFDGVDDFLECGSGISSDISAAVTFEAWIKPKPHASSGIVSWGYQHAIWIDALGRIVAEINVDGNRRDGSRYPIPAFDQWYHVIGMGSAAQGVTRLFVNGQEVGMALTFAPGNLTPSSNQLTIGSKFKGIIDHVRIYDRLLSPAEVLQRYQSDAGIAGGLIGAWDMDENSGDLVEDSSGRNHGGYIVYTDITARAYGDEHSGTCPATYDILLSSQAADVLYIGQAVKFDEINIKLAQGADAGWNGVWEYWNGSTWAALTNTDGTNDLQQSGAITFTPPDAWTKKEINTCRLFWVRLRCTATGITKPIARSIAEINEQYEWKGTSAFSGHAFARSGSSIIVPAWDGSIDQDRNGYITDAELAASTVTTASARFRHQARVPSRYFTNRWVANMGDAAYRAHISSRSLAVAVDGVFIDNIGGDVPDYYGGRVRYAELGASPNADYQQAMIGALAAVKNRPGQGMVLLNGPFYYPAIVDAVDGLMFESAINYLSSPFDTYDNLLDFWSRVKAYAAKNKTVVVHGNPLTGYGGTESITRQRDNMYTLARYYLTAEDNTYFKYEDSLNYAHPWEDWFDAIGFDIGTPEGDFYIYDSRQETLPDPAPENLVQNSSFETNTDAEPALPDGWLSWHWQGSADENSLSGLSKTGAHALEIAQTAGNQNVVVQYVSLSPNTTYTFSGWVRTEDIQVASGAGASIYLEPGSADWSGTTIIPVGPGTYDWRFLSGYIRTGGSTSGSRIYCVVNGTGRAWFDDIQVREGYYPLTTVYARRFTQGLVLLKTMPPVNQGTDSGDATATMVSLDAGYLPLSADGTLGAETRRVSLRNYEGAVLASRSTAVAARSPNTFLTPRTRARFTDVEEVTVAAMTGREVICLKASETSKTIFWDGRDENGTMVESGSYLYRARTTGGKVIHGLIVVAR